MYEWCHPSAQAQKGACAKTNKWRNTKWTKTSRNIKFYLVFALCVPSCVWFCVSLSSQYVPAPIGVRIQRRCSPRDRPRPISQIVFCECYSGMKSNSLTTAGIWNHCKMDWGLCETFMVDYPWNIPNTHTHTSFPSRNTSQTGISYRIFNFRH